MREGRASATAEHNALFRALESFRPAGERQIEDPLAGGFLTFPLSLAHRLAALPGIRRFVPWFIDRRWPGVRTAVVARTRLIDDTIERLLGERVEQLVVLGAGFDSRAWRILLFTYVHRDILTRPGSFAGSEQLFASLERFGERFTFGIHPDELADFLSRRDLSLESDVGCAEFRARYYGDAAREMRGHEFYRVALARIPDRLGQPVPQGIE